jgi:hypothetical protein
MLPRRKRSTRGQQKAAQRLLKTLYRLPRAWRVLALLDQPKLTGQGLELINLLIDKRL